MTETREERAAHATEGSGSLSVVLIAKNEERNIARLIESVLRETRQLRSTEVVLVDSSSSDQTVSIAARYPVRIVRLVPDRSIRLCAAAGRFVGTEVTDGERVLFLDGDHELCHGWLATALNLLERHRDIGVVGGLRVDVPKDTPAGQGCGASEVDDEYADAAHAGPAAVYRREVLDAVGGFVPFLISDEEPELSVRIRESGHRVVRTNRPVVVHRTDPEDTFSAMFARRRRGLYLGFGQNLRYHIRTGFLGAYLRTRWFALPVAAVGLAGVAAAVWSITVGDVRPVAVTLILVVGGLGVEALRRRSVYSTLHSLVHRLFILEGSIRGVRLQPLDPQDYLRRVETVK